MEDQKGTSEQREEKKKGTIGHCLAQPSLEFRLLLVVGGDRSGFLDSCVDLTNYSDMSSGNSRTLIFSYEAVLYLSSVGLREPGRGLCKNRAEGQNTRRREKFNRAASYRSTFCSPFMGNQSKNEAG